MQDSLVGSVVDGRYAIASLIGRGGMAAVYRARDKRLERDIALKLMHPHLAEKPELNARFNKEARAAAQLASPHLVAIHDQGVWASPDGPRAYLVMEYVPGPDVRSELQRLGSFTLATTLALVEQVLRALEAAHAAGIVHRDVKPENILLTAPLPEQSVLAPADIHAKVADFGLAHVIDADSAATGTILGTVAYIPPESVGSGQFAAPADLYSLGIMAYEFLTGTLPFKGETPMQTAFMHMNEPMPRVGEQAVWLPAQVDSFIARLTAKNPADRPADARHALAEFERMRDSLDESLMIRRVPIIPLPRTGQDAAAQRLQAPAVPPALERTARFGRHERQQQPTAALGAAPAADERAAQRFADPSPAGDSSQNRSGSTSELPDAPAPVVPAGAAPADAGPHASDSVGGSTGAAAQGAATPVQPTDVAPFGPRTDTAIAPETAVAYPARPPSETAAPVAPVPHRQAVARAAATQLPTPGLPTPETAPLSGDAHIARHAASRSRRRIWPAIVLALALLAGAGGGGAWYFLEGPGRKVEVPAVVGETDDRARNLLEASGFLVEQTEAYSDDVARGLVISSSPEGGSLRFGSTVTIAVSLGIEQVTVPNVVSMTAEEASQALKSARLEPQPAEDYSETVEAGRVISQNVEAESMVDHDSPVGYTVSKGREPIAIPEVAGKKKDDAVTAIEGAGLAVSTSEAYSDTVAQGSVISQEPAKGTAFRGDTVTIVVSKGPETVEVPNVTDLSVEEAKKKLEAAGLKAEESRPFGISRYEQVWMQSPTNGTTVKKGSSVKITII